MYTTTQLLLLLFALTGAGGPAPSYGQSRNEVASTAAVNVLATVNGTPIASPNVEFAAHKSRAKTIQVLRDRSHILYTKHVQRQTTISRLDQ